MKGVLIVRQIMAKKEILLHRINQMSRISAFCDHLALINYASEIAPVGQAASQAPYQHQASQDTLTKAHVFRISSLLSVFLTL